MINPQVCIVDQSMEISRKGTVTGVIFFDFDGYQFPEANWNDSVIVVLTWWLSDLISLLKGEKSEA
jgi:hypothetical protein